jgi:hypothetical protein
VSKTHEDYLSVTVPNLQAVNSSHVAALGWLQVESDLRAGTLAVEFKSGALFYYAPVPAQVYERLQAAPSIGSAFTELIRRGPYVYRRVR